MMKEGDQDTILHVKISYDAPDGPQHKQDPSEQQQTEHQTQDEPEEVGSEESAAHQESDQQEQTQQVQQEQDQPEVNQPEEKKQTTSKQPTSQNKASSKRAAPKPNKLEAGWNSSTFNSPLPEYNPLYDKNLRQFFEKCVFLFNSVYFFLFNSPKIQKYFLENGFIDKDGRVIDLEKNKAKMLIIEQEFRFDNMNNF